MQLYSLAGGEIGEGTSYIVGYGPRWPLRPHHRQASCPADGSPYFCTATTALLTSLPNPHQLAGRIYVYFALALGVKNFNGTR
jgi:hypothetical protein